MCLLQNWETGEETYCGEFAMSSCLRLHTAINRAISYPDQCDLMVHPRKCSVIFSWMHFVTVVRIHNMHQGTKSAQLIAVFKRTFIRVNSVLYYSSYNTSCRLRKSPFQAPFLTRRVLLWKGGLSLATRQNLPRWIVRPRGCNWVGDFNLANNN